MGLHARVNAYHSKRANCLNARCRAWLRSDVFPLCPACRLAIEMGVGVALLTLGILLLLWWGLT